MGSGKVHQTATSGQRPDARGSCSKEIEKQSEQKIKIDWHQFSHYVRYLALLLLSIYLMRFPWQGMGRLEQFPNFKARFGFRFVDPNQGLPLDSGRMTKAPRGFPDGKWSSLP
jgi:hypothetical protein